MKYLQPTHPLGLLVAIALLGAACADDPSPAADTAEQDTASDAGPDSPDDTGPDVADVADAADAAADAADLGVPDLPGPGADAAVTYTEEREPCADRNALRNLYWGDLHVHTGYSFDAYVNGLRLFPDDAYAFARGATVLLPPLGEDDTGTQPQTIDRPLDFAAVTDHAEFLAEVTACVDETSPAYDTANCERYRRGDDNSVVLFATALAGTEPNRPGDICAAIECRGEPARGVWADILRSAEEAYDRTSDCEFTTFVGYEWTASTNTSNLHRNVIFRNDRVPDLPVTYFETSLPVGLWRALVEGCEEGIEGCEVLAIPHNSNWSNGRMFDLREYPGAEGLDEEREQALLRQRMEPLFEIFQHKGQSECMNGLPSTAAFGAPDELCDFEYLRPPPVTDCRDRPGTGAMAGLGCVSRNDFVRFAMLAGMQEAERLGVNPLRLGFIASSDTHNAIPGAVEESSYLGHTGSQEDTVEARLDIPGLLPGGVINNPGGLMGVWSVENSRDAIFEAMQRRETYGTSGPRIAVRFFGSYAFGDDLCTEPDLVERAYVRGVPMGADLPAPPVDGVAPRFVATALADPGTSERPGALLQRIEIVKGWLDADGQPRVEVFTVAGDPDNGATVDEATCEPSGAGATSLCGVWTDPAFDPAQRAYYYVRVAENPSCRWTAWECNRLPEADRPPACTDPDIDRVIQELAWTSPIWYEPAE